MSGKLSTTACIFSLIAFGVLFIAPGCRALRRSNSSAESYDTLLPNDSTANQQAKELNRKGLRAFKKDQLPKAETLFRDALKVDSSFGPAHNNLGQIYLAQHQLYLAAWEFEYASNLMPELVEPIINQGLAYETGERLVRAEELYQQAYDQDPTHPVAIASLARTKIKQDGDASEIAYLLSELIMHDGRQEWVEWAKELRATRYRDHIELCDVSGEPTEFGSPDPPGRWNHDQIQSQPMLNSPIPAPVRRSELVPTPVQDLDDSKSETLTFPEAENDSSAPKSLLPAPPRPLDLSVDSHPIDRMPTRRLPERLGMRTGANRLASGSPSAKSQDARQSFSESAVQQASFSTPAPAR